MLGEFYTRTFMGPLQEHKDLKSSGIEDGDEIQVVLRMRAGGKKSYLDKEKFKELGSGEWMFITTLCDEYMRNLKCDSILGLSSEHTVISVRHYLRIVLTEIPESLLHAIRERCNEIGAGGCDELIHLIEEEMEGRGTGDRGYLDSSGKRMDEAACEIMSAFCRNSIGNSEVEWGEHMHAIYSWMKTWKARNQSGKTKNEHRGSEKGLRDIIKAALRTKEAIYQSDEEYEYESGQEDESSEATSYEDKPIWKSFCGVSDEERRSREVVVRFQTEQKSESGNGKLSKETKRRNQDEDQEVGSAKSDKSSRNTEGGRRLESGRTAQIDRDVTNEDEVDHKGRTKVDRGSKGKESKEGK